MVATREGRNPSPRTKRLLGKGRSFIAKKVAEEGVEVALEAVIADSPAVIRESADLLYNLVVLWVDAGVAPEDIWAEMKRREQLMGMAEKLPKRSAKLVDGRQFALSLVANVADEAADQPAVGAAIMVKRRKRG